MVNLPSICFICGSIDPATRNRFAIGIDFEGDLIQYGEADYQGFSRFDRSFRSSSFIRELADSFMDRI